MSRHGTAWSVKGVDQATRDIARRASQAAGLTIGEWIDQAIRADAEARGETVAEDESAPSVPAVAGPGRVSIATVDALAARLDAADARFDAAMRPVAYALHDIAERLVALERRAAEQGLQPPESSSGALEDRRPGPVDDMVWPAPAIVVVPGASREVEPEAEAPTEPEAEFPDLSPVSDEASSAQAERRPLPEAPPADWEPVVWIRRADLAQEAQALRAEQAARAVPAAEPDRTPAFDEVPLEEPGVEDLGATEAGPAAAEPMPPHERTAEDEGLDAAATPVSDAAGPAPAPVIEHDHDAIRFEEPTEEHPRAEERPPAPRRKPGAAPQPWDVLRSALRTGSHRGRAR